MSLVNQPSAQRIPSSADWSRLEPLITELYVDQRLTMDQIRQRLNNDGYRVTKRMVRKRISDWNLHRNQQMRDMAAALRLLDLDPTLWTSPDPRFLIRRRSVTLNEICYTLWQKKVRNPFLWAYSIGVERQTPHVTLLTDEGGTAVEATGGLRQATLFPLAQSPMVEHCLLPMQILMPDEKAAANLHEYCSGYIGLTHSGYLTHQEPPVHQYSTHGQFGERMRDGIAHMTQNSLDADLFFLGGFQLVQNLLSDCHPMALAQYLSVVCILATHHAHTVLSRLLRYVAMQASRLGVPDFVIQFLSTLQSSQDVLGTAVTSLRAAVGVFTQQYPISWQRLYIEERFCDCLAYCNARNEGSAHRALVLCDQEAIYGPLARNVLWTLMNVADDQSYLGNMDDAKEKYQMALARAEHLTEPGRAKIRFAALEGLAHVEQRRFEKTRGTPAAIPGDPPATYLQNAYYYIEGALREAFTWFEPSSRRTLRALSQQKEIVDLLASIGHQTLPNRSFDVSDTASDSS